MASNRLQFRIEFEKLEIETSNFERTLLQKPFTAETQSAPRKPFSTKSFCSSAVGSPL